MIVKAGRTNRLDFALSEGVLMDAVEIVEYKVPLIEIDNTTSGAMADDGSDGWTTRKEKQQTKIGKNEPQPFKS